VPLLLPTGVVAMATNRVSLNIKHMPDL